MYTLLAAAWLLVGMAALPVGAAPTTQPLPHMPRSYVGDIETLYATLKDPSADLQRRRLAVQALLDTRSARALEFLRDELDPKGDAAIQSVIAQAIAARPQEPPNELNLTLVTLLDDAQDPLTIDLASALGRFRDRRTLKKLAEAVVDHSAPLARRRGAILALSYLRSQAAAKLFMDLAQPDQPTGVRQAAFEGLSRLTGLTDMGDDWERWSQWWEQYRRLGQEDWVEMLLDNHARRGDGAAREFEQATERTLDLQRQLYRWLPPERKTARLVELMEDGAQATRRLGMELSAQRLIDAQPFPSELRAAILDRLNDPDAMVRKESARLLRDLGGEAGAEAGAQRLARGQEQDVEVLHALLKLIAGNPRPAGVSPSLDLLARPELASDAAMALVRATDADLLNPAQVQLLTERLRPLLTAKPPAPAVILLLGRVAQPADWDGIKPWLTHADVQVRAAAAGAWARSEQPVEILLPLASDAALRPVFLEAMARRGRQASALQALLLNKPTQEPLLSTWQKALTAVAGRAPADAVLEADRSLAAGGGDHALRERMLSAALGRYLSATAPTTGESITPDTWADPAAAGLLLARGQLRLEQGEAAQAMGDLKRLLEAPVAPSTSIRNQAELGLFRAKLLLGDLDGAGELARRLWAAPATQSQRDAVASAFLEAAQRSLSAQQLEPARNILARLRQVTSAMLSPTMAQRLADLESLAADLGKAAPPATRAAPGSSPAKP